MIRRKIKPIKLDIIWTNAALLWLENLKINCETRYLVLAGKDEREKESKEKGKKNG